MTHETPRTNNAEAESIKAYEDQREAGWPSFPCDGYDLARAFERENNQLREHLESVLPHAEELSRSGLTDDVCKAARAFLANSKQ